MSACDARMPPRLIKFVKLVYNREKDITGILLEENQPIFARRNLIEVETRDELLLVCLKKQTWPSLKKNVLQY